jgi:competence protein ComEC
MRRPGLYALILFIAGIILGDIFDLPLRLLFSTLILTFLFCIFTLLRKDIPAANFFIAASIVLAGFLRYDMATRDLPPNHISRYLDLDSKVTVQGNIADDPDIRADKTFLNVNAERIFFKNRVYLATGNLILKIKEPSYQFNYGDEVETIGYLYEPSSRRNPGAFDYKRYLNRKNVYGMIILSKAQGVEILGKNEGNVFQSKVIIPLRKWILSVFNKTLTGDHKALLSGFLLGDTKDISHRVYTMFRDTGTVHLLAVSGSNVWLVVGVIFGALTLLRVPRYIKTILGLLCVFIFANLTHNEPPVVRASVMAGVVLLGSFLYKDVDLINVVSFAGLLILSFSPLFFFDVGFQLSFASVFAILILYPQFKKLIPEKVSSSHNKIWKWVIVPALISLSVEIVLFPILGYYFNLVPLVCVMANVFIVPLAGVSVILACFTLFSAIFSSGLAGIFSAANWLCLELTLRLNEFFAALPIAKISIPSPSPLSFLLYYTFVGGLVSFIVTKKRMVIFPVLVIANLLVWKTGLSHTEGRLKMTFLDMNQSSCVVLRLPDQRVILINAGERAKNFNSGEQIVIPFLNHEGISRIDKLILTDDNFLSLNSARTIIENVETNEMIAPDSIPSTVDEEEPSSEIIAYNLVPSDSVKTIRDAKDELSINFYNYLETDRVEAGLRNKVIKLVYENMSFCFLDGMKNVRFDSSFAWEEMRNCSILVLPELGEEDDIIKIISFLQPQGIIFTRHYLRYEKDKIPAIMQFNFPKIEYYRTAEKGAITCKTDGKKLSFDFMIR